MKFNKFLFLSILFAAQSVFSQEGIAVYTDYLTDNYYLIHPSMAGASNCSKLRLTGRQQWFGQEDAPALQTLSFNTSLGKIRNLVLDLLLLMTKMVITHNLVQKLTYAHHLMFSRSTVDLNMLSFGLSGAFIQSRLDESRFTTFDPVIVGGGFTQRILILIWI